MRLGWRMAITLGVILLSWCLMEAIKAQAGWQDLTTWDSWIREWHGVAMGVLIAWCWGWLRCQRLPGTKPRDDGKDEEK